MTVAPPLTQGVDERTPLEVETGFTPFRRSAAASGMPGCFSEDRQVHALYLGDADLLKVEGAATIALLRGAALADAQWSYWGREDKGEAGWRGMTVKTDGDRLLLAKRDGAIEPREVEGRAGRWIRAERAARERALTLRELRIATAFDAEEASKAGRPPLRFEAFANTVPLVTNTEFYPLGREPRLFDTFYLSCPEAFSKPGAKVTLQFVLADATLGPLVATSGASSAFAVAQDGSLYRLDLAGAGGQLRIVPLDAPAVRPPGAALPSPDDRRVALTPQQRPAVARDALLAAARAGADVWLWALMAEPNAWPAGWSALGAPAEAAEPVALVLSSTQGAPTVFAAVGGSILARRLAPGHAGQGWQQAGTLDRDITRLVGVQEPLGIPLSKPPVLLAVTDGALHLIQQGNAPKRVPGVKLSGEVEPVALRRPDGRILVMAADQERHPVGHLVKANGTSAQKIWTAGTVLPKGGGFALIPVAGSPFPVAVFRSDKGQELKAWLVGADEPLPDQQELPADALPGVQPAWIAGHLLVAGPERDVFVRRWEGGPTVVPRLAADLLSGVRLETAVDAEAVERIGPGTGWQVSRVREVIEETGVAATAIYVPEAPFSEKGNTGEPKYRLLGADADHKFEGGEASGEGKLTLNENDKEAAVGRTIRVEDAGARTFHRITELPPPSGTLPRKVAGLLPPLAAQPGATIAYDYPKVLAEDLEGAARPVLNLHGIAEEVRKRIEEAGLVLDAVPTFQRIRGFGKTNTDLAALGAAWTTPPKPNAQLALVVPAPTGATSWDHQQDPTDPNPELSWEYWNGFGWWRIERLLDNTRHLLDSRDLTFDVPADIAETDIAGRTSHWIRSRLIGGEYGREVYKVESTGPDGNKTTVQTAVRDTSQIRPPRVLGLAISYEVPDAEARPPEHMLSLDSGGWRDQAEANRARDAVVTAFEPLGEVLGRLGPDRAAASGHGLYIGCDAPLRGGSIRLLALVAEQAGETRLMAEALRDGRFAPVPLKDETGGLHQPGMLTLSLDAAPSLAALFGVEAYWLRLRPTQDAPWQPELHGLFLNAVMAEAAETQEFEILGSSDGAPRQRVFLARPPVLPDSLELRVREPLGEEEIAELRRDDPGRVLIDVEGQPGAWVRWREVGDPDDAAPRERGYALDHASGEVRFGDGLAGMIPPPGLDAVAAFSYRRGGGAAANAVQAWDALQLVTPVEGVEAVVAPRPAAGGADPAGAERTIAFAPGRIRHRDRAVTAADLEALALAGSPEIAQARCIPQARPPRLVVVLRGADPRPGKEFRDALRRRLVEHAAPGLGAAGGCAWMRRSYAGCVSGSASWSKSWPSPDPWRKQRG
ncbi:hypothetical protein [Siccirubricoccus sp. G192]|uniref:hypothetical protein n=1 Tax=Siccirubricoccus sp. G192 TaxID=2849651 RepID=UPI001C2C9B32|nr:hypothetical protein [Siccirubricoccus sp. G192]MBV1800626.1 hypothetical protein [Siccirubricoccus sp. G192]MBV1800691.1 hypothetical protein [Siccirubricoccus sp. G192]